MAVGLVPYIAHSKRMKVYSWNMEMDRGVSWDLPPEVTNSSRPIDCGVIGMTHCWTPMGRSLLLTTLMDCYQIWDVEAVGGPGQLLHHCHLGHHIHCLALAWDDDSGDGDLRLFQYWQEGYFVSSYKLLETLRGGFLRVECGRQYVPQDASFQCHRHSGHWVTTSLGRSPPDLAVRQRLCVGDLEGDWSDAEGWIAHLVGFKGWEVRVQAEATVAARRHTARRGTEVDIHRERVMP